MTKGSMCTSMDCRGPMSDVFSKSFGDGPVAAVCLHGWAGDHRTFEACEKYLGAGVSLLSLDMPGYGKSVRPEDWPLEVVADQIAASLQGFPHKVALLGNCSGAVVSLFLAQRHPELFDRLILVEPFAFMPWYFRIFLIPILGRFFYWSAFGNPLGMWITDRQMRDQKAEGRDLLEGFRETPPDVALGYLGAMKLDNPERFADISMPVTILAGERTMPAVKESVRIWQRVWPQAEVHWLQGAGHLLLQEDPRKALQCINLKA